MFLFYCFYTNIIPLKLKLISRGSGANKRKLDPISARRVGDASFVQIHQEGCDYIQT